MIKDIRPLLALHTHDEREMQWIPRETMQFPSQESLILCPILWARCNHKLKSFRWP